MALKCPRTQTPLKEVTIDGIKLDISEACGGVWFDNQELQKMDNFKETAGDTLIDILQPFGSSQINFDQKINCPKCPEITLMRNYYSPQRSVQIDTCGKCGGVWIDPGELVQIRKLFANDEEKEVYGQRFADEMTQKLLKPELERVKKDGEGAHKFANMLRFICPSNYIKGKQDWGAF